MVYRFWEETYVQEFESKMDIFHINLLQKIVLLASKRPKMNEKEPGDGPLKTIRETNG